MTDNFDNQLFYPTSPHYGIAERLVRYWSGDRPVYFLKYVPKNDWFGKFSRWAIS